MNAQLRQKVIRMATMIWIIQLQFDKFEEFEILKGRTNDITEELFAIPPEVNETTNASTNIAQYRIGTRCTKIMVVSILLKVRLQCQTGSSQIGWVYVTVLVSSLSTKSFPSTPLLRPKSFGYSYSR